MCSSKEIPVRVPTLQVVYPSPAAESLRGSGCYTDFQVINSQYTDKDCERFFVFFFPGIPGPAGHQGPEGPKGQKGSMGKHICQY